MNAGRIQAGLMHCRTLNRAHVEASLVRVDPNTTFPTAGAVEQAAG